MFTKLRTKTQDEQILSAPSSASSPSADARPMIYIIKEGRLVVSPDLAKRILTEADYEKQRHTYPHHVAFLSDAVRRGRWTPGSQIAFGYFGGRLHMVNGRHRMLVVIETGEALEFQVLIVPCETEAQLDALYWRFDRAQRSRTTAEVLNAARVADKHGLSKGMSKSIFEAVPLIANHFVRPDYRQVPVKARSDDWKLEVAREWWKHGVTYQALIDDAEKWLKGRLLNSSVTAVALVTLKYNPEKAQEFWGGVSRNDGLRRRDPRHTLIADFNARPTNKATPIAAAIVSATAWSAFFEGRTISHLKVYENSVVRIAGTPFDGRRK